MISFNEYQAGTKVTAIYRDSINKLGVDSNSANILALNYCALKLNGEAGEVAELVGKLIRDDYGMLDDDRREAIAKELGDVLWYVSQICNELGLSMGYIADSNLRKLESRMERGKLQGSGSDR